MREQKWIMDKMVQLLGVDFHWPVTGSLLNTAGLDLNTDVQDIRARVKKLSDIPKELLRVARKREQMAIKAAEEEHFITARDNYFSAAVCYNLAQTAVHEDDIEAMTEYNAKKAECYNNYIEHAPHPIERVEIPFEDKSLPGLLHIPANSTGKVPCVLYVGGMEMFKETINRVYNDKMLERGLAVLAFDGPGQGESRLKDIMFSGDAFIKAGKAAMDFLVEREEIASDKIGLRALSLGSRMAPFIVAGDPRFKAVAVHSSAFETKGHAHEMAFPHIKPKVMWMQGIEEEEEFDKLTRPKPGNPFKKVAAEIKCPFLIIAGEDDELSPIEYTYDFYEHLAGPKKLKVYEGEGHGVRHGNDVSALMSDWLKDRLDGKPMESEIIYVETTGREIKR
jgi:dipeptidyl aminopeptidase/acylaminoacyl peptidase